MTIPLKQSGAPAALPPAATTTMVDAYDEPHVTLTLRVTVTRDQLAGALDFATTTARGEEGHPDTWTVEQIRNWTEGSIALMDCLELQQSGEAMATLAAGPVDGDGSLMELVQALYRAIDRAYPAPGVTA